MYLNAARNVHSIQVRVSLMLTVVTLFYDLQTEHFQPAGLQEAIGPVSPANPATTQPAEGPERNAESTATGAVIDLTEDDESPQVLFFKQMKVIRLLFGFA